MTDEPDAAPGHETGSTGRPRRPSRDAARRRRRSRHRRRVAGAVLVVCGLAAIAVGINQRWGGGPPVAPVVSDHTLERSTVVPSVGEPASTVIPAIPATAVESTTSTTLLLVDPTVPVIDR